MAAYRLEEISEPSLGDFGRGVAEHERDGKTSSFEFCEQGRERREALILVESKRNDRSVVDARQNDPIAVTRGRLDLRARTRSHTWERGRE
jgi:hypothetical protein